MLHEAGSVQNNPEHFANTTVGNAKNPFSCMDEISIRSNAPSFTNVAFGVDEDGESFIRKFLQGEIYLLNKTCKASSYESEIEAMGMTTSRVLVAFWTPATIVLMMEVA